MQILWAAVPCYCVNSAIIFTYHPEDEGMKALQLRRSVPEVPNRHFCKNGALCAKRFTSYSYIAIARNREMWDRRLNCSRHVRLFT
jgi:hypothetical protein